MFLSSLDRVKFFRGDIILLEFDFALTTGKHTQMTKESSKGMRDLSASKN